MSDDRIQALDLEIKQLERDKKVEEIRQLKASGKTNWVTPAVLIGLLPFLAGFGVWAVGEMKQYGEGYRALADKERLEREGAALQQQKLALNQEIVALLALKTHYADEFKGLEAKVKERQAQIDVAHLRMRFLSAEARYALAHVVSQRRQIGEHVAGLTPQLREQVDRLVRAYELAVSMIRVTDQTLKQTDDSLKLIPASDWTAKLQPMPTGSVVRDRKIMIMMDNSELYDVDAGRFLTSEEIKARADR